MGAGFWNYLRVRGEYTPTRTLAVPGWELPPRARRIRGNPTTTLLVRGTTSACAENTNIIAHNQRHPRNYLRVRGEYHTLMPTQQVWVELPPRARRIPPIVISTNDVDGTTSACAENTLNELGLL